MTATTATTAMTALLYTVIPAILLTLAACGDDDDVNGNGGNDSIWTGLSGLVIVIILGYIIYRALAKRRG